jgi:SSS family solute:Na+ symporter
MNGAPSAMSWIDWALVALAVSGIVIIGSATKRLMRSVADFLAAGRSAGRYLITLSYGVANIGAISVLAFFQGYFESGFTLLWWEPLTLLAYLIVMMTGFVFYRYRRTRSLTLAEFFERRYGRPFRLFAGVMVFLAGILNFAIFPLVGSKFFVYFCGLPTSVAFAGIEVQTFQVVMVLLLGVALWFVCVGGQVSVIATDFAQSVLVHCAFIIITLYLVFLVDWGDLSEVMLRGDPGKSRINPFDTQDIANFGFMFFVVSFVTIIYGQGSWQGEQAYLTSARTAHELRMGGVLRVWTVQIRLMFYVLVPVFAFVVLRSPEFASTQESVSAALGSIADPEDQARMRVPLVLADLLPVGLRGLFAAMMLCAFISTHNTYLHSWGSVFIQDVALPIASWLGFEPKRRAHIRLLRIAVVGVALFAFIYSTMLYSPKQPILIYMDITGALFLSWSGAVIIGGLYWPRGTTRAAWASALLGSGFVLLTFAIQEVNKQFLDAGYAALFWGALDSRDWPGLTPALTVMAQSTPDGKQIFGITIALCSLVYYAVSKASRTECDLDELLHGGAYEIEGEVERRAPSPHGWFGRLMCFTEEHTRADRVIYIVTAASILIWVVAVAIGTALMLIHLARGGAARDTDELWLQFWRWRVWFLIVTGVGATVWLTIGGVADFRRLLRHLATAERHDADDGIVTHAPRDRS